MNTTLERKLANEVHLQPEQGFPGMSSVHYLQRLKDLHQRRQPKAYFEIGTESGASLSFASCLSVAVDPQFKLEGNMALGKPALHLFQSTSDDFFATGFLDRQDFIFDLAFLDGMHLFEYLLRDFINTERRMSPDGMVVLHDCVPGTFIMAERTWQKRKTLQWTGDVWKLLPILREYRPDLFVSVRDYAPTGLVEITGLDPDSTVLAENYDEIVDAYMDTSLESFGVDTLTRVYPIQRVGTPAAKPKTARRIAIKVSMPNQEIAKSWGDYHFSKSLADGFNALGHETRIDIMPEWPGASDDALDLVLQGHDHYPAGPERASILWYIYPGKRFPIERLVEYDHVFIASQKYLKRLAKRVPGFAGEYLPQAFDPEMMKPKSGKRRHGPVFVGNNHFGALRPIVGLALEAGYRPDIWGARWEGSAAEACVIETSVENEALGAIYASSTAVLCDQTPVMARNGFLSNRVYDALACGAPVITTNVAMMPARLRPFLHVVGTPEEFDAAMRAVSDESSEMQKQRKALARDMTETDTFKARAKVILEAAAAKNLI